MRNLESVSSSRTFLSEGAHFSGDVTMTCSWQEYGLVVAGPALAWLYAVIALIFLWAWHECTFFSMARAISLRSAFLAAALAVTIGICHGEQQSWNAIIPLSLVFTVISIWLIYQTRVQEIEGGPAPTLRPDCMKGKVVFVTGANAGIGKETVRQLADLGATVVLGCRSESRANEAIDDVRASLLTANNNNKTIDLRFIPLDLSDLASVRRAAELFKAMNLPPDVLINNAGVMMGEKKMTKDGYELMMQANHLGHFLLTTLLLDMQKPGHKCRVITVSSSTYALAKNGFDFDDVFCESTRKYTLFSQYAQTKLANILLAKELATRYSNVQSWAVHPGLVRTDVVRNMPWYLYYPNIIFAVAIAALQKQPTQGAYTSVYCAATDSPPANGEYLVNCKVQETNSHATNALDAKRLWELSEELVRIKKDY